VHEVRWSEVVSRLRQWQREQQSDQSEGPRRSMSLQLGVRLAAARQQCWGVGGIKTGGLAAFFVGVLGAGVVVVVVAGGRGRMVV